MVNRSADACQNHILSDHIRLQLSFMASQISDDGPGIDLDKLEHVFKLFSISLRITTRFRNKRGHGRRSKGPTGGTN